MQKPQWLRSAKAFVLDMDGTIYLGDRLFSFTVDFLETLNDLGKSFYFFTNNSSKPLSAYVDKLVKMGIPFQKHQLMNATQVMMQHLREEGVKNVFLLGTHALQEEFALAGFHLEENPERVIVGFDTELHYEKVRQACDWIREGVQVLGINPDLNCPIEGGMIPDCGSIGAMIEASTGVKIEYFGKPHRKTFDYVLQRSNLNEEELVWVGDRLYTDIAITHDSKAHSILVLSGESHLSDLANSLHHPDLVVENLEELKVYLKVD
jgi:glycerol-1-phosphate dehydrogenase [NAD(P)+]